MKKRKSKITSIEKYDDQPSINTQAKSCDASIDYGILPELVGYRVRKAASFIFQTFTEMLRDQGLAPGQYNVLLLISLNPGLSQMKLADATGIDRSTIVPIINRFVQNGWVRRNRRPEDRRVYSLSLTSAGQSILDEAKPKIEQHEEIISAKFSKAEKKSLIDLLRRLSDG